MDQSTFCAVARHNIGGLIVSSLQCQGSVIEPELAFGFFRAVTAKTGQLEDRLNILVEVDLFLGGWRKLAQINLGSRSSRRCQREPPAGFHEADELLSLMRDLHAFVSRSVQLVGVNI